MAALDQVLARIEGLPGTVARLARALAGRCRELALQITELTAELTTLITVRAPGLIAILGCGAVTAAKILGETAGVGRFRSKDAYARHNGTAPLPVWFSNKTRHRLSRTGNRCAGIEHVGAAPAASGADQPELLISFAHSRWGSTGKK